MIEAAAIFRVGILGMICAGAVRRQTGHAGAAAGGLAAYPIGTVCGLALIGLLTGGAIRLLLLAEVAVTVMGGHFAVFLYGAVAVTMAGAVALIGAAAVFRVPVHRVISTDSSRVTDSTGTVASSVTAYAVPAFMAAAILSRGTGLAGAGFTNRGIQAYISIHAVLGGDTFGLAGLGCTAVGAAGGDDLLGTLIVPCAEALGGLLISQGIA